MSRASLGDQTHDLKQELKLVLLLFPIATFLGGVGLGFLFTQELSLQSSVLATFGGVGVAFVLAASYYFRKIDQL